MDENLERALSLVKKNPVVFGLMVAGLVLVGIGGVWSMKASSPVSVEIIEADSSVVESVESQVWVDVQGAVVSPGVYELEGEVRVKDALSAAGGLAEEADRSQIARYVNLAAKVNDGVKIYIPKVGEKDSSSVAASTGVAGSGEVIGVATSGVNINTASVGELDKLWGVGPARASDIIDGRPYEKVEDVAKVIPSNVYERIKDELSVY